MIEYDGLLRRLADLAELFDEGAETFPSLYHQFLLAGDEARVEDWPPFIQANSRPEGDWQHFEVFNNGWWCARFFGFEDGLADFTRLAGMGYDLLAELRRAADSGRGVPHGFVLSLPEPPGLHGWTRAVYSTAQSYATARLFEREGDWDRTGLTILDEEERWIMTGAGGRRLSHPAYQALGHDVFTSSAEAIRLWLDPESADRVGWDNEHPEIILPGVRPPVEAECRETAPAAGGRPVWNPDTRELWVGPRLVKRYRLPAENQCLVLMAFEESGWPPRIDNPIPPGGHTGDPSKRLRDTIQALNRYHATSGVIRFEADGTGEGIVFRLTARTA